MGTWLAPAQRVSERAQREASAKSVPIRGLNETSETHYHHRQDIPPRKISLPHFPSWLHLDCRGLDQFLSDTSLLGYLLSLYHYCLLVTRSPLLACCRRRSFYVQSFDLDVLDLTLERS